MSPLSVQPLVGFSVVVAQPLVTSLPAAAEDTIKDRGFQMVDVDNIADPFILLILILVSNRIGPLAVHT